MTYQWLRDSLINLDWSSVDDAVDVAGSAYIISPTQTLKNNTTTAKAKVAPHFHYFPNGDGRGGVGYPHGSDSVLHFKQVGGWYGDPDDIYVDVSDHQMTSGTPSSTKNEICNRLGYALAKVERMDSMLPDNAEQMTSEERDILAFRNWYFDKIVEHLTSDEVDKRKKKKKDMLLMCLYKPQHAMSASNTLKVGTRMEKYRADNINLLRPVYQEFLDKLAQKGIGDPVTVKMAENLTRGQESWLESGGIGLGAGSGKSTPAAKTKETYLKKMATTQLTSDFQKQVRQQQASKYGGVEMIIQALINPNKLLQLRRDYLIQDYPDILALFNFADFTPEQVSEIQNKIFMWVRGRTRMLAATLRETKKTELAAHKSPANEELFVRTLHQNIDKIFGSLLKDILNKSEITMISPEITEESYERFAIEARKEIATANGASADNKKLYPENVNNKAFRAMSEKQRLESNKVSAPTRDKLTKKKKELLLNAQREQLKQKEKLQVLQRSRGTKNLQDQFQWVNEDIKKKIPRSGLEELDELTRAGIVQLVNQEFINRMLNNLSAQIMERAVRAKRGQTPAVAILKRLFETLPRGRIALSQIVDATNNKLSHRAIRQPRGAGESSNASFEQGRVFYHHLSDRKFEPITHSVKGAVRGHREHMFYPDEYVQLRIPADRSQGTDLIAFISTKTEHDEQWQELDYREVLNQLQGGANSISADNGDGSFIDLLDDDGNVVDRILVYVFNVEDLEVARKAGRRNAGGSRRTRRRRKDRKKHTIKKRHKKKKHKKKRTIKKRHKKRKHRKRTRKH